MTKVRELHPMNELPPMENDCQALSVDVYLQPGNQVGFWRRDENNVARWVVYKPKGCQLFKQADAETSFEGWTRGAIK